jgi:GT2 family glycosyltransferase
MENVRVGIVMPCINLWAKYTKPALDTVALAIVEAEKHGVFCEALLINNGSTDETHDAMMTTVWPGIREGWISYQRNEEVWGFQKSVNFGVNHFLDQKFDLVLVLNNDIALHVDAIWRLVDRFGRGRVSMATCLDATGECERIPDRLKVIKSAAKVPCAETPHPCFSAFMLDRACWKAVGEFDELFHPAYYEDNDYHYRMQLAGLVAVTYPPALFFHWGSATQLEALGRPLTDSANQHANYVRKWGGNPGQETFKHPFNDESKTINSVAQTK